MNKKVFVYILNKIKNIKNIVHIFITSFLITIVFICLTILKFCNDFYDAANNNLDGRTLVVKNDTSIDLLKSNEHIIFADYDKYRFGYNFYYNDNNYIYVKAILDDNYLNIIDGKKISHKGEMVCSKNLYPYEYSMNMDLKKSIDSKTMINSVISNGNFEFKMVGTYENIEMEEANVCYISMLDFDKFNMDAYDQIMVIYDNKENKNDVHKFLDENNISYIDVVTLDETYDYLKTVPLYIIIVVLLIILFISYNFTKKNLLNSDKTIGILQAYGERTINIKKYFVLYHLLMLFISIIITISLSIITYYLIKPYLIECFFYNLYIKIPIINIISFILFLNIYIIFIVIYLINNKSKHDIYEFID